MEINHDYWIKENCKIKITAKLEAGSSQYYKNEKKEGNEQEKNIS